MAKILTMPESNSAPITIRAKALVFHDPQSRQLLDHVERLARSDATVLVTGETGTGKELIARHIHACSGREGPFVAVNCGAFSESLIDAELFGHESGAFTGAAQARAGWFEAADGGTLFLDEIGDLSLSLQVKLLRVLQERQVVRIGSRKPIALDVRLIAATNVDLRDAVNASHFRADLYYRLSVATLELRPLYERPGDILPLARHFLASYATRLGIRDASLSPDAEQALLAHDWPGNIRELENVIHYALIVAPTATLHVADLQGIHRSARLASRAAPALAPAAPASAFAEQASTDAVQGGAPGGLREVLLQRMNQAEPELFDAVESTLVKTAFEFCHGNQVQTAHLLGLSRNVLRTLLKRHGLLDRPAHADHMAQGSAASAPL